ncbi:MAG: hypothetical protein PHQ05_08280 [Sterolibacterium sp.]|nr:hypothetical protein [Sterolibacterium sp.]
MMLPTPPSTTNFNDSNVIERPDGFYLQDRRTGKEYGPYATLRDAVDGMEDNANIELEPCEDIKEAEEELGIADWIDPETGALAEESIPHIEDH